MSKIEYQLSDGLSKKQLRDLHVKSLLIIEKIGIDVPHKKSLKLLSEHEGVIIKGTRVYFKDWLVNECTVKKPYQPVEDNQFKVQAGVICLNILDLDGKTRPAPKI